MSEQEQSNYQGPGRYRHYKGGEYLVLGLGLREETVTKNETRDGSALYIDGETVVIYKPLTPGSLLEHRAETYWTRPLDVFNEWIWAKPLRAGDSVQRFSKLPDEDLSGLESTIAAISAMSMLSTREEAERILRRVLSEGQLVQARQLQQAVENTAQLDMLRRCHEDRTELKQALREAEAEVERLRAGQEVTDEMVARAVKGYESGVRRQVAWTLKSLMRAALRAALNSEEGA